MAVVLSPAGFSSGDVWQARKPVMLRTSAVTIGKNPDILNFVI